ncbi:MAG: tripartite tricarboxylate transporter substrate binding protein [Opitutales bacterium]|jgi:tripartite-type tricarboxylate transporter receptor subunit TctC|nr:tripartite tricarboxylate transporter substrate binding protein [Opitutales bacterium]MBT5170153.1 tripartite tricarboxylate transporter substrate binding protein [Opitutales bacterium]MBT6378702.1 tripartite tricarboxylate transporter substrate binding protein [Opitutales bacterium]MDG2256786.1 tripartite tricarboxylate transporter substrate binding protein [Opitutaceae bacterium]
MKIEKLNTKISAAISIAGIALLGACQPASGPSTGTAADFPSKSGSIICPWAPGGGTDRMARFMADQLQKELGKPFVVVNQTGGSGAVGHSAGALAKPDGHTLTMATFELSTMHWMGISDLTWKDYAPVAELNADAAAIMVRSDSPWNSLKDLIGYIEANPGKLTMSGTATGGAWDLARAGFQLEAGIPVDAVRWIPSKGSAPSIVELLGGHIDAVCCSIPEAISQIEAGQLRALVVMSPEKLSGHPDLPTAIDEGVDWSAVGWRGIVAPKGTPPDIVKKISDVCSKIVASAEFEEFMRKNGFATEWKSNEAFAVFLEEQDAQWKDVIEATGYARQ